MNEGRASSPVGSRRAAWLEVDLSAIASNLAILRGLAGPGVAVGPVVKANAYGHGLAAVGRALDGLADALCVATLDEALALRAAGVSGRILILYPVPGEALAEAFRAAAEPSLMGWVDVWAVAPALEAVGSSSGSQPGGEGGRRGGRVQLALDTGLARGGFAAEAAGAVMAELAGMPGVSVAGVWSHLVDPGDPSRSGDQVAHLERAADALRAAGLPVPARHVANSGGLFARSAPALDLVRPGLALYGVLDADLPVAPDAVAAAEALIPAMSLKARAVAFADVPVGGTVGYGGHWRAERPSRVAILPLGYADGFLRGSWPGAGALVGGRRVPLVGVISMDALAVDVTDLPDVRPVDEFVLLGRQGDERITAAELARVRNTIEWEVLSSMAERLGRVYHPTAGTGTAGWSTRDAVTSGQDRAGSEPLPSR